MRAFASKYLEHLPAPKASQSPTVTRAEQPEQTNKNSPIAAKIGYTCVSRIYKIMTIEYISQRE